MLGILKAEEVPGQQIMKAFVDKFAGFCQPNENPGEYCPYE